MASGAQRLALIYGTVGSPIGDSRISGASERNAWNVGNVCNFCDVCGACDARDAVTHVTR